MDGCNMNTPNLPCLRYDTIHQGGNSESTLPYGDSTVISLNMNQA